MRTLFSACLLSFILLSCKKTELAPEEVSDPKLIIVSGKKSTPTGLRSILTAYDIQGIKKWQRSDWGAHGGVPQFGESKIFFTGTLSEYHAIEPNSGATIWKITEPGGYFLGSVVINNTLYIGVTDANVVFTLRAYNATNGSPQWSTVMADPPMGMISEGDMIYYFSFLQNQNMGYVAAFNTTSKTEAWRLNIGSNFATVNSGLSQTASNLYISNGSGKVLSINKATGTKNWETASGYVGASPSSDRVLSTNPNSNSVVAFDQSTGALAWQSQQTVLFSHSNILNDEVIVSGFENWNSSNYIVEKLDVRTGASRWRTIFPALGIYTHTLFAGSRYVALEPPFNRSPMLMIYNSTNGMVTDSTVLDVTEFTGMGVLTTDGKWIGR